MVDPTPPDREMCQLLREIRDDQREAIGITRPTIRSLRILVWFLVALVAFVGLMFGAFVLNAMIKINALE
jgi:hypothetical protein